MDGRISLTLGNVLMIGSVSVLSVVTACAVSHWLSHRDIPVLSPTARAAVDFMNVCTSDKVAA